MKTRQGHWDLKFLHTLFYTNSTTIKGLWNLKMCNFSVYPKHAYDTEDSKFLMMTMSAATGKVISWVRGQFSL